MKKNHIEAFLYVNGSKDTDIGSLKETVSQFKGVIKASVNQYVQSVMYVEYDPQTTSGSSIVSLMKQKGVHAALVAL